MKTFSYVITDNEGIHARPAEALQTVPEQHHDFQGRKVGKSDEDSCSYGAWCDEGKHC